MTIPGYKTAAEVAAEWGLTPRHVRRLCDLGRVPGAIRPGRDWLIPEGTPKPADRRRRENRESPPMEET